MYASVMRVFAIVFAALILAAAMFDWDNRDPNDSYWHVPTPAFWFFLALASGLLIYATRKQR